MPDFTLNQSKGFTLIELMIGLVISIIVGYAIFWSYNNQQDVYRRQQAIVDMQQNLRGGIFLISQELRMAGYDRLGTAGAVLGIATSNIISFSQDLNEDNDTADENEDITLQYNPGVLPAAGQITRTDNNGGTGPQPFIDNVDGFELNYTIERPNGTFFETTNPPAGMTDDIRAIEVSILVRSSEQERELFNNMSYRTGSGAIINALNDAFRRRMLITTIQCRNAAL